MKPNSQNPKNRSISRLFLTASVLSSLTAGWLLGSFTTAQSKSNDNTTDSTVFSIPVGGETLPTVMLKEFSVVAS